jgi:hypothetical protein
VDKTDVGQVVFAGVERQDFELGRRGLPQAGKRAEQETGAKSDRSVDEVHGFQWRRSKYRKEFFCKSLKV